MVRDEIIEEVKKSEQFALIADETKDLKKQKKKQMVFVKCCRVNKSNNWKFGEMWIGIQKNLVGQGYIVVHTVWT